jgi:hypothetical protein
MARTSWYRSTRWTRSCAAEATEPRNIGSSLRLQRPWRRCLGQNRTMVSGGGKQTGRKGKRRAAHWVFFWRSRTARGRVTTTGKKIGAPVTTPARSEDAESQTMSMIQMLRLGDLDERTSGTS